MSSNASHAQSCSVTDINTVNGFLALPGVGPTSGGTDVLEIDLYDSSGGILCAPKTGTAETAFADRTEIGQCNGVSGDLCFVVDKATQLTAVSILGPGTGGSFSPADDTPFDLSAGTYNVSATVSGASVTYSFTISEIATDDQRIGPSIIITTASADNEAPVIAAVTDVVAVTDAGLATASVAFATTVSDNVDATSSFTPVFTAGGLAISSPHLFPVGETTVTVTANDDAAGNSPVAIAFKVTVTDGENPVFAGVPSNITQSTDTGLNTAVVTFTPPTVTDNIDGALTPVLVSSPTAGLETGSAFPVGVTTLTYTATDAAGNIETTDFTVTVSDDEAPTFTTFPSDMTLSVDFPTTNAIVNWIEPNTVDNAPGSVSVVQTAGPSSGASFPIGTTTITYTATDVVGNVTTQNFTVTVTAIPPGTVTFVVNSGADGTYNIASSEPALNSTISVSSGTGTSGPIVLRSGTFPITFTVPSGVGVESAQCNLADNTLSAELRTGIITLASGEAVICTITTRNSSEETVAQIGQFLEARSQLILQHQPNRNRRIDRLEGRTNNNGGVTGFGLSYLDDRIPFAAEIGRNDVNFSYSMLNSRSAKFGPIIKSDVVGLLSAFKITPSLIGDEPLDSSMYGSSRNRKTNKQHQKKAKSDNLGPTAVQAGLTGRNQFVNFANIPATRPFDIWAEGHLSWFETGDAGGNFGIVHLGADYLLRPHALLGLSTQVDWTRLDNASAGGKTEGYGFLLTPYFTAKLSEALYFDARLGWGKAKTDISPFGTYTDSFGSERWLATVALTGKWAVDDYVISPEARLSYYKETSATYEDSLNVVIPSVEVETGVFEFGPTIRKNYKAGNGALFAPSLTIEGIWTFSQKNTAIGLTNQDNIANEGLRARIQAGVEINNKDGSRFNFSANYDGIGNKSFSSLGLDLGFEYEF